MNQRELEILNILWGSDKPMTSMDIVHKKWVLSQSTVQAVLRKLLKEELVEVKGKTFSGNVTSRQFVPTPKSKEEVLKWYAGSYQMVSNIISWQEVDELYRT